LKAPNEVGPGAQRRALSSGGTDAEEKSSRDGRLAERPKREKKPKRWEGGRHLMNCQGKGGSAQGDFWRRTKAMARSGTEPRAKKRPSRARRYAFRGRKDVRGKTGTSGATTPGSGARGLRIGGRAISSKSIAAVGRRGALRDLPPRGFKHWRGKQEIKSVALRNLYYRKAQSLTGKRNYHRSEMPEREARVRGGRLDWLSRPFFNPV